MWIGWKTAFLWTWFEQSARWERCFCTNDEWTETEDFQLLRILLFWIASSKFATNPIFNFKLCHKQAANEIRCRKWLFPTHFIWHEFLYSRKFCSCKLFPPQIIECVMFTWIHFYDFCTVQCHRFLIYLFIKWTLLNISTATQLRCSETSQEFLK